MLKACLVLIEKPYKVLQVLSIIYDRKSEAVAILCDDEHPRAQPAIVKSQCCNQQGDEYRPGRIKVMPDHEQTKCGGKATRDHKADVFFMLDGDLGSVFKQRPVNGSFVNDHKGALVEIDFVLTVTVLSQVTFCYQILPCLVYVDFTFADDDTVTTHLHFGDLLVLLSNADVE